MTTSDDFSSRLGAAIDARAGLADAKHEAAYRLFNGFVEGRPGLAVDLYATTAVIFDHAEPPESGDALVDKTIAVLRDRLPWLEAVVRKPRRASTPEARRGHVVYGEEAAVARRVRENGVWYAVDLFLNQDASLFLDTRGLRSWALEHLPGKSVLNTFAYTGSLGVAARAAGARCVVHVDLSRAFLNVAKASYTLNGFPIEKNDFRSGDFWKLVGGYKHADELFDCVIVDPPFFSTTANGTVNLVSESSRVLNKVRPLVGDGGWLVAVNNALFVSGAEYVALIEKICADGYLSIESFVEVPPDSAGYPETRMGTWPTDPAPFVHPTKIAILRVRRKDSRTSETKGTE